MYPFRRRWSVGKSIRLLEGKVHHVSLEIFDPQLSVISPTLAQLVVGIFVLWGEGKPLDASSFRIFMATLVLWLVLSALRLRSISKDVSVRQPAQPARVR